MFESIINPAKAERKPWEMIIIGMVYAILAVLVCDFLFLNNPVFEKYVSILIVCFTVFLSIPFVYYIFKIEEKKDTLIKSEKKLFKEHGRAILALIFLFLGYVIAFSLMFTLMSPEVSTSNFKIQTETYCQVNSFDVENCVRDNTITTNTHSAISGNAIGQAIAFKEGMSRVAMILSNNFYVFLFTLLFSLLFGAGAIFILAWNASVIATAIGIYAKGFVHGIPSGFVRYMIHGIPEISAYFIVALAGGILSVAVINREFGREKFVRILQDSLDLIILGLIVLIVSAFMEVFLTPILV